MDIDAVRAEILARPDRYGADELTNLDRLAAIQAAEGPVDMIMGDPSVLTFKVGGVVRTLPKVRTNA